MAREQETREMLLVVDTNDDPIGIVDVHPHKTEAGLLAYSICVFEDPDMFEIVFTPEFSIFKQLAHMSLSDVTSDAPSSR